MRTLEKFKNESLHILGKNELSMINGAKEASSICGTYEVTCDNNCEDRQWVHYNDGVETWREKVILTSDCNR